MGRLENTVIVVAAFLLMEPVAYLAHRFVMHGAHGGGWHVGHHQVRRTRFEANDLYPLVMAVPTVTLIWAGSEQGWSAIAFVGLGVTVYGLAYLFVHDVYIHRRWKRFTLVIGFLEPVRDAHRIHHLWGGEPYGFLLPVVPAALRERALSVNRDPLAPVTS